MRLAIKLIRSDASVNSITEVKDYAIVRGESRDIFFQLWDSEQNLRWIPAAGSTVQFQVLRNDTVLAGGNRTRIVTNYGIDRAAIQPVAEDQSICKVSLVAADTVNLISTGIKVIVTDTSGDKKIASLGFAIRIIDGQDS